LSNYGRRPAQINTELLIDLKLKKKAHRRWKQGQATWWQYKDSACTCRNGVRKAKASLELKLAKEVKRKKKGF